MHPSTVKLVQGSWPKVAPIAPQAAALFYQNLFRIDPSVKDLFGSDMVAQGKRLMQMIGAAVGKLDDLPGLVPVLQDLARRHVAYKVEPGHYQTVGAALLQTLEQGLGEAFTPEVKAAWTEVYGLITQVMLEAAGQKAA